MIQVLHSFAPKKPLSNSVIFYLQYSIWFTDQSSVTLELQDGINLTMIIN